MLQFPSGFYLITTSTMSGLWVAACEPETQPRGAASKLGSSYKETSHCKVKLDQKLYR